MAQLHMRSWVLGLVAGALALSTATAYAQTPKEQASALAAQAKLAHDDDTPPLTAYDRMLAENPTAVQPETKGLMHLAGRLFAALIAVLALIYGSLKFLLPRYFKKWSHGPGRELKLVERLSLDGHNAVVLVETRQGHKMLLGTGEHGVQFLTRIDAPDSPSFEDTLTAGATMGVPATEERHAAEH